MRNIPQALKDYTAFVFDLDNTLYKESDFLFAGYRQLGESISKQNNVSSDAISDFLINEFTLSGREGLFQKLNNKFRLQNNIDEYLDSLRNTIVADINLFPVYYTVLACLRDSKAKLYILTNGNPQQQKNKIGSINWKGLNEGVVIYYANEYARKPDKEALEKILREQNLNRREVLFVGDTLIDEGCANNADIDFMYNYQFEKLWL